MKFVRYVAYLNKRGISDVHQGQYKRGFDIIICDKYPVPAANFDRVRLFCEKLQEKNRGLRSHNLVVKVLFGCGLRLFEGLQLRVRDFNFDVNVLTIHGKGKKDRIVPLPESILSELKAQIKVISELHDRDLTEGYDEVPLRAVRTLKEPKSSLGF